VPDALRALLDRAVARHRAGEVAQAEAMYRELARQAPGHPELHHLLGVALHQQRRNPEARAELRAAIDAFPQAPHFHDSLGEVLRALGDLDGALASHRRALELAPDLLPARNNLGLALHAAGRFEEAAAQFRELVQARPELSHAHNNLGIAQQSTGDLQGAVASFRRACELEADNAQAWNNLGAALHAAGDLDAAREALERAAGLAPELARVHFNLSRLNVARDDLEAAEESIRRALALDDGEADLHVQLGLVLRGLGRMEESVAALHAALGRSPRHPIAHNDLGVTLLMDGEFEQAERHLLSAVESAPGLTLAYENLARCRRFGPGDAALMQRMSGLLEDPAIPDTGRIHLGFALAKMWDDREEPQRAFAHAAEANRLVHARSAWDAGARARLVDRLMRVFDGAWFERRSGLEHGNPSPAPVLIVGMLRSGTTLVEQILASHPKVLACGELDFFANLAAVMPQRLETADPWPECARLLSAGDLDGIAASYLAQTLAQSTTAQRFTDKNPLNFDHLGVAAVTFPNATLVHVTRDPMDTCLSIFMTHFSRDNGFAYDLDDIAAYYRDYRRLMEHWRAMLGARLHEVAYEDLVADQERSSRALVAACGLEWDPACLDFHRTRRTVGTASHWQVRQPLYADAVGRWRRYASWLEGLRERLEA